MELPATWILLDLGEVAEVSGGIQKQQKRRPVKNIYPFLRVANVGRGKLALEEVHDIELFEGELEKYRLRDGDLLVVEGNGSPDQIGRAATWRGAISDAVHQNHLIRVRPTRAISARYLELVWNAPVVSRQLKEVAQSTSGLYTLSTSKVKRVKVPLPPLAEQDRIVEALEDHLSRLDSAASNLDRAQSWSIPLRRSALARLRDRAMILGAQLVPLEAVAQTSLGKMLDSKKNAGSDTPYLRNVNVRWGEFDLEAISSVPMPPEQAVKFALNAGDLLVCEGGEPGRCAIWPGSETLMTFQKALHRVRPSERASSCWLALMIEECVRNGRTARMLTGTTIKHLPQEKLRKLEIPVPHAEVQARLVEEFAATEIHLKRLQDAAVTSSARERHLRGALLSRAFLGRLVLQDPADEPASVLLDRIRSESEAQGGKPKRAGRPSRRSATADEPPPPPPESSTLFPINAVQQELPL
ncbi:restriction modification system DNA specificity subunit [Streptomyces zinciresistens K42]|uniref:Restriction modification system DNA specificity subunit n=1 Tax=Streptomyces zinciresistens K42 TaxID=700597 RepID=G2GH36_9ACTN|nr:restriction endonuclease subunit S [Streptomyces zinciresistens]EGX57162.1 restriction modification system DNA specificity subunit [Streptomyces zinciresistens K42]